MLTIFCEGVEQGPDIRLLEAARVALQDDLPIAEDAEIRAAGSRGDLNPLLRLDHRRTTVRALRDRDFTPQAMLDRQRQKPHRAYPLSRHSIESYLLDSKLFSKVIGVDRDIYEKARDEEAHARLWTDVGRGVIEQFCIRHRLHPSTGTASPGDRPAAISTVETSLNTFLARVEKRLEEFELAAEIDDMHRDMISNGPVWARVDGRSLLWALRDRFDSDGKRFGKRRDLRDRLVARAEIQPPAALIEDLRGLLLTL